jgi:5-methylcytosine-specific restriction endonuclease McrA
MQKINEKHKKVLREMVNFTCQGCNKKEDQVGELEIHRIIRGYQGGLYVPNNIQVLCSVCHKLRHYKEFKQTGG